VLSGIPGGTLFFFGMKIFFSKS
jgi:hypothetical protein